MIHDLMEELKEAEGFRQHCYVCTEGKHTVGYGRNIDEDGGLGLSQAEAEMLLANDVQRSIDECSRGFGWFDDLDPVRQAVIAHLAFWIGYPSLSTFNRMSTAIARQEFETAANELLDSKLAGQVPSRTARLAEQLRG